MDIMLRQEKWNNNVLLPVAQQWIIALRQRKAAVSAKSVTWWNFLIHSHKGLSLWLRAFTNGHYTFSPMLRYRFFEETMQIWGYQDRLMVYLLLRLLRNTFKHVIGKSCMSTHGPAAIKPVTRDIKTALTSGNYHYVLRIDIKSYYASIDKTILLQQLNQHYHDPIVLHYFEAIVNHVVDDGGYVYMPERGIPLRSSLSPFFGALYLTPLDEAFASMDVFYRRYVDDIIILVKSKSQFAKAKKRLFEVLRKLKLKVSPQKTKLGKLSTFHFLGVNFEMSRNSQIDETQGRAEMHKRCCRRALDNVITMRKNAVPAAIIQRYLIRWATWWKSMCDWSKTSSLMRWSVYATWESPEVAWLGRGLIAFEASRCNAPLLGWNRLT